MIRLWRPNVVVLILTLVIVSLRPGYGQSSASQPQGKVLALVGGLLIEGYPVPPVQDAAIIIRGNTIVAIGRAAELKIPVDATVIDTRGRTMMPGLVDAHVHLALLGHGSYPRWMPWLVEHNMTERVMEVSAKQLLMAGITSAIDLGGPLKESLSIRDRIDKGEVLGPRMSVSGPWLVNAGSAPPTPEDALKMAYRIDTPESAGRAVDELARAGVDVIKAYTNLTAAHYAAIVQAAHKNRIRVHAHVYDEKAVRLALENGVDVLQHVGSGGTAPPYSAEMIRDVVNAGRPVVTTIAHRSWIWPQTIEFETRLKDPGLEQAFGPMIWKEVQDSLQNWHTLAYFGRVDREMAYRAAVAKQWIDSSSVMGMGTDSGTPMNFNSEALWREIVAHVEMGMTPQKALDAATRVNAQRIIGNPRLGTIEPGQLADIIVVNGNPLYDINAIHYVDVVVKDGIVYKGGPGKPVGAVR